MWIASKYGYFSVVMAKDEKVQVRARARHDLEYLIDFGNLVSARIDDTPGSDYCCRIVLPRSEFARVMGLMVLDLDYPNFKEMIVSNEKQADKIGFYEDVWAKMFSYQMSRDEFRQKS